ncbi:hypothetical protein A2642_02425 [Candidatus Nomurabacteria bacterium RIFCSPHIGHO2_01_FULL_39_10]|uniref:Uncharacterized protein n=1 Tax=Candidatus Nomurabacteria bacterium RIFCSPHIGHO2_01_FULL_39_10 TaxID=1801733 RepID=A0A1F6V631_9BACT|nr:MAG: hypothetical protein A2642_02425 [Candidatus Nomurabacteria bacterium RIFCSPHIGHO2_01_FULL_39_10]
MNIGIINTYYGKINGPMRLDQMLADFCSINPNLNTKLYQSNIFKPHQVQQDRLDYILTYGGTKTEDNFVKKLHTQNPVPILYLLCPGNTNIQQRYHELTTTGIETYHDIEELMSRLLDIGRHH